MRAEQSHGTRLRMTKLRGDPSAKPTYEELLEQRAELERELAALLEVRADKDRLSALIASMADEVWFADQQEQFTLVNPSGSHEFSLGSSADATGVVKLAESLEVLRPDGTSRPVDEAPPLRALRGEFVRNQEEIIRTPATGALRYRQVSASPVRDASGEIIGSVSVVRDITERKRAEEALRESEARHRLLAETILHGIVHQDQQGRIISMNVAAERILGKTRDEFLGSSSVREEHDTIREDGSLFPGLEHPSMVALRTGTPVRNVVMGVFNPRNKEYRWIDIDAVPLFRPGEKTPYEVYTVFADITDRKRAEEAQRAGTAILNGVLDSSLSGIMAFKSVRDATGRITDFEWLLCNATAERMVGRPAADLIGRKLLVEMPGNGQDGLFDKYVGVVETGVSLHHEHYYEHEGLKHWFETCAVKLGDGFAVTFSDISDRKKAENALRSSESLYRAIGESIDYGVWVCDRDGRNTYASESFLKLVGMTQEQCSNFGWGDVLHPDDAERTIAAWKECVRTGGVWDIEHRYRGVDGKWHPVLARGVAVRDERGEIICWAGINLDISHLKQTEERLRENEQQLRDVIDGSPTSIVFLKDLEGRFLTINKRLENLLGTSREALRGKTDYDIFPPDKADGYREHDRRIVETGEALMVEEVADLADGRHTFLASKFPLRDPSGRLYGVGAVSQDISLVKEAEDTLREANARLMEADRRRSEFLGVLSHELRNPLTPIRNSLYILERASPGSDQARRALTVIDRQVGHLARLVDDLLDVTRIARGKIRLLRTRLDLVDVVRRTLEDHHSLLEGLEVEVDLPKEAVWIDGDPTRMAQVVGNLLNNAVKFTPEDGKVSVWLRCTQGRAVLDVADSGLGLDTETLQHLFEPFAQADRSLDRSRGGLGLGLALVKGMVELHGGEVTAQSDGPGRGARFTIRLPMGEGQGVTHNSQESRHKAGARRRVLIIEDNMDAADSLSEALELSGHQVAVAYDGKAGLDRAREFRPDVVICDIGLPAELDGYSVARALRQEPATASAYLIALTGYAQPEDQRRAENAGFNAHLAKPADLQALERLLADAPPLSGQ